MPESERIHVAKVKLLMADANTGCGAREISSSQASLTAPSLGERNQEDSGRGAREGIRTPKGKKYVKHRGKSRSRARGGGIWDPP